MNYADFGVNCAEELEQDEWSLTRPTFETPKGGVLTILGIKGKSGNGSKEYVYHCSICCKDRQMYGDGLFYTRKPNSTSVSSPSCGCSKSKPRTKDQNQTLVIRKSLISGHKFDGWVEPYGGNKTKLKLVCNKHGSWDTTSLEGYLRGNGCPLCANVTISRKVSALKTKTLAEFLSQAKDKHGSTYDYSEVKYVNGATKIRIICRSHGVFEQTPENHLRGKGCKKCATDKMADNQRRPLEDFLEKAKEAHGDKYDYSLVEYQGCRKKVKIICQKHGVFEQTPTCHLKPIGQGCPLCGIKTRALNSTKTQEECLAEFYQTHGRLYDYSSVRYKNWKEPVKIICRSHGIFKQSPMSHVRGNGCPLCGFERTRLKKILPKDVWEKRISRKIEFRGYALRDIDTSNGIATLDCRKHGAFIARLQSIHQDKGFGCLLCAGQNQKQAYLHKIIDEEFPIAIKLGISVDWEQRLKALNTKNLFKADNLGVWEFPTTARCRQAEKECKQTLKTGVLSAREMKDGWTETVSVLDIDKVIAIYEKHGGKRIK